jgi:hypothetical protein
MNLSASAAPLCRCFGDRLGNLAFCWRYGYSACKPLWVRGRVTELVRYLHQDRVAPGRYHPGAPTDPYLHTLAHTVPLIMDSLRT